MASENTVKAVLWTNEIPTDVTNAESNKLVKVGMWGLDVHIDDFHNRSWWFSPVSAKIGLPLKAMSNPVPTGYSSPGRNNSLNELFLGLDPNSKTFGLVQFACEEPDVVITRCDGGDLEIAHLRAAKEFIKDMGMKHGLPNKIQDYAIKKQVADSINPAAFKKYFEELRRREVDLMNEYFIGAELPDAVEGKFCHKCGTAEEEGKEKLLCCGGCKSVYYCNKKCQKQGWKVHKPDCKA